MAARKKSTATGGGGLLRRVVSISTLLAVGLVTGYLWRSYQPLPLPFESRLVSDGLSSDLGTVSSDGIAQAATRRAEAAERERDALKARLDSLESQKKATESELADFQIKGMLQETN